jgi:hypothetical protein
MALLYAPLLHLEAVLLRDGLIAFATVLIVYLTMQATKGARIAAWLMLGVALGLSITLKSHFAAFLPLPLFCALRLRVPLRQRATAAAALMGGLLLGVGPLIGRNALVGAPLFHGPTGAVPTFIAANSANAGPMDWDVSHAAAIMARARHQPLAAALQTIQTHPTPYSYPRLLFDKLAMSVLWYEIPSNANVYYYALLAPILGSLPLSVGVVAPLAVAGMVLAWPRRLTCAPLYWMALVNLAVLVFFFPFSRFRVPLILLLLPFAAYCGLWLWMQAERRAWGRIVACAIPALLAAVWTMNPATALGPRV